MRYTFKTRSTHKGDMRVEICSSCHPFFTGRQKLMDTAGRIDRSRKEVRGFARRQEDGLSRRPRAWQPTLEMKRQAPGLPLLLSNVSERLLLALLVVLLVVQFALALPLGPKTLV